MVPADHAGHYSVGRERLLASLFGSFAMKRILLHTCCGPCTLYPLDALRSEDWSVHGFFYNTNIQPYQEWQRRLEALETVAEHNQLPLIVRDDYDLEGFLRSVAFREQQRCITCYSLRLEAAARLAKKSGFSAFTTTLLYSKRQKHDLIRALAESAAHKHGIDFLYRDFRIGWRTGQTRARELGIYRQQYCGCIFSERDRFYPRGKTRRSIKAGAQASETFAPEPRQL
jgi:predicted adenine nucleotide alpha hydrolase (AANH) superfamily ATPase